MGVAIDGNLIKFKNEVAPAIGIMTAAVSAVVSKITSIVAANNSTKAVVESAYKSANQAQIYGKFDEINSQYANIQSFINSTLNQILNSTNNLLSMIGVLVSLKEEVDAAEKALIAARNMPRRSYPANATSAERAEVDSHNAAIDREIERCLQVYNAAVAKFNQYQTQTLNVFSNLKGSDASLSVSAQVTPPAAPVSNLSGTFTLHSYNGLDYYIYLPDNVATTSGLPVTVYLHGAGENSKSKVTKNSLPYLLNNGLQTNGIVVCPVSDSGKWLNAERTAVKELTDAVVKTYNADTDRISMAGYSNGAGACYQMAVKYDGYYSCIVPIAGDCYDRTPEGTEKLTHTKIWAFHGNKDYAFKIEEVSKDWKRIANAGGAIDASVYDAGHGGKERIMTKVFEEQVSSSRFTNGQSTWLLKWMQEQTRQ